MLSVWKKVMQVPFSKIKLLVHKALNPSFRFYFSKKKKIQATLAHENLVLGPNEYSKN
jgi:hypothetical protein